MCLGLFKRVCHWGPLTALAIIKIVSYMMVHCSNMLLPPTLSLHGFLNMVVFLMFSGLTLYNFFSAMVEGPGYLPLKWAPEYAADEAYLQVCGSCKGYKAPRSHHCRKCGRCVLKMDHHCPWINNCVGHANHAHFVAFLFFAVGGCAHAAVVMSISLYRTFNWHYYMSLGYTQTNMVQFTISTLALTVFAVGLSIGVVLSVGALLYFQLRVILRNRTGIEEWILSKAICRRNEDDPPFIYPYNLGYWKNFTQVINLEFEAIGDGIHWPVREGCSQYTLTIEQKEQKAEKRMRTLPYIVETEYNGSWCPFRHGFRVLCSPPLSDEPRIPLEPSETVNVTRWRKYWLFGEKINEDPESDASTRMRGWFPRCCVMELGLEAQDSETKKTQ
uniref:Palmitoyltransferase n=2 Tax=Lygus hesperus TaxID=30085 RepID=A0A0A9Z6P4_LYGHE